MRWIKVSERLPEITMHKASDWVLTFDPIACRIDKSIYSSVTGWQAEHGELIQATHWRPLPLPPVFSESPSSVPEPDAEKDQRIAELENQIKEMSDGHAAEMKSMYESGHRALDRIQQLEAQLQASKVDADKLWRVYMGSLIKGMTKSQFIKAIQSLHP